jgi:hypothetical protein
MSTKSFLDIVYEDIEGSNLGRTFGRIRYNGFNIMIMTSSIDGVGVGYINATEMCKSRNSKYKDWSQTIKAKRRISHVKSLFPNIPITILVKGGNHKGTGTYVHESILSNIALSISEEFGDLVNLMMSNRSHKEHQSIILAKDALIGKTLAKNISLKKELRLMREEANKHHIESTRHFNSVIREVAELNAKLDVYHCIVRDGLGQIFKQANLIIDNTGDTKYFAENNLSLLKDHIIREESNHEIIEQEILELKIEVNNVTKELVEVKEEVIQQKTINSIVATRLGIVVHNSVAPPQDEKKRKVFVLIKLPLTSKSTYPYQVLSTQKGALEKNKYYKSGDVLIKEFNTNPDYIIGRLRTHSGKNYRMKNFGTNGLSEEDFIKLVQSLLDEDKNVDNIKPTIYTEAILKGQTVNYLKDVCKKYLYTTKSSFKKDDFIGAIIREQAKWQVQY